MRQQLFFSPTMREIPQGADIPSHQLMLRAGLVRQTASGIYSYLPLGKKVLRNVEEIIREEMDNAGAQELLMPAIQPTELWEESGRLNNYGPELMRLKDRHERDFVLGPTHEEVITSLVRDNVNSYKKLPMNLYQIQTKYRDERRPRFGVLRSREFMMKDAYSFDTDKEGLDKNYQAMFNAYTNIFSRCCLDFRAVKADAGAIGGKGGTHEFMVLSDVGEDTIAYSGASDYAANVEIADLPDMYEKAEAPKETMEDIHTPNMRTIEELTQGLQINSDRLLKSLLFLVDDKPILVVCRGDHEINEIKVSNAFEAEDVRLAEDKEVFDIMGVETGFIGPVNVPEEVTVVCDFAVKSVVSGVCGANKKDKHYQNVHPERDFSVTSYGDFRLVQEGDPSPDGKGTIQFAKGIEVGHVFKLGTKYSEALGAVYLDENGRSQPMIMGCYGIGVSRTIAAIVEQHHDDNGLIWPKSIAPFDVHVLVLNTKQEEQVNLGESLYESLKKAGYNVLIDDRKERAGVKFKDADLLGLPIRVTCGKRAAEGIVEVKTRRDGNMEEVHVDELDSYLTTLYQQIQ
ncbi:prolyl-tRNA synthetase [Alteribacillus persepolensis]|uniref:Proline--tRNA ligase n=1 Tax=Alteribacillus persepolensis TaxID=568899 RepID=A0A1G7YR31_9BACI|nr:proline--tRNA ligase [Alteribacillus persepolensis]SDG99032.1 prolyl-tRNA synthetase [Alteribacillus persepolensis]